MNCEIQMGGDSLSISIQADHGLGFAPLHRLTQRGPMQHGSTDVGFRLDPRIFTLAIPLRETSMSDLYDARQQLMTWLTPGADVSLLFTLANGEERQIDCSLIEAPMDHDVTQVWSAQVVPLRFYAPDPCFYDPTTESVSFGLDPGAYAFTIPLGVPVGVGPSDIDQTVNLTYEGNFRSYPWRLRIEGPITDPVITNVTTDEKFDFTGVTIADGDHYDIDCRYGQKGVEDASGTNKVDELTSDSDLATFHLAPHPEATDGINEINVTGSAVTSDTEVYMIAPVRYLGI